MDYQSLLAQRTENMSASAIREILKVVSQPGMISLAGGNPDPKTFPLDFIKQACGSVIEKYGATLFQYGVTEGFMPLREALSIYLKSIGIEVNAEKILISSGATSAINAVAGILIDKGDKIGIETPSFLGSIKTFKVYQPEFIEIETDDFGIIPEKLEDVLQKHKLKFVYIQPNFQNPTGKTLPNSRREEIAQLLIKYQTLALEDDPYHELNYSKETFKTLYELAPENIIYVGSLSKIFSPGIRLGYSIAPDLISEKMVSIKQGIDVHSDNFAQALATEYLNSEFFRKNLKNTQQLYSAKMNAMKSAIKQHFPSSIHTTDVLGGMFIWCWSEKKIDNKALYNDAITNKVAFVPGSSFYVNPPAYFTMRLNFTNVSIEKIEVGIEKLGKILHKYF
jgi:2-aminoadipate transaminase